MARRGGSPLSARVVAAERGVDQAAQVVAARRRLGLPRSRFASGSATSGVVGEGRGQLEPGARAPVRIQGSSACAEGGEPQFADRAEVVARRRAAGQPGQPCQNEGGTAGRSPSWSPAAAWMLVDAPHHRTGAHAPCARGRRCDPHLARQLPAGRVDVVAARLGMVVTMPASCSILANHRGRATSAQPRGRERVERDQVELAGTRPNRDQPTSSRAAWRGCRSRRQHHVLEGE